MPEGTEPKRSSKSRTATRVAGSIASVLIMRPLMHRLGHLAREHLTHWAVAGLIVTATGAAPEHWVANLIEDLHIPTDALHLWAAQIDLRWVFIGLGLTLVIGDIVWRRGRPAAPTTHVETTSPPLPDKPSIAVLPFVNLSGDPAQEYFSDGIADDIITELSRFRALFVIARNSTFAYKNIQKDVRDIARELGVHYVLEGSTRVAGDRVRISAQLIDATTGSHLWAERFDDTLADVFAVQAKVTRGIVAAVAPEVEQAEMAHARQAGANDQTQRLTWLAQGLMRDGVARGQPEPMLRAIEMAQQALAADPTSLAALNVIAWSNWSCHLYRWIAEPGVALSRMTDAVDGMRRIDPLDHRTLTASGVLRVVGGDRDRGLVELRRALEINPNASFTLMWLSLCEAMAGDNAAARDHANLSLRLNPRDTWIGVAQVALALVSFAERDYAEAARLTEIAIQSEPAVPLRRAIMIACCARLGDLRRAEEETAVLNGFAPDFLAGLLRGEMPVFHNPDAMAHLLDSLRMAGVAA